MELVAHLPRRAAGATEGDSRYRPAVSSVSLLHAQRVIPFTEVGFHLANCFTYPAGNCLFGPAVAMSDFGSRLSVDVPRDQNVAQSRLEAGQRIVEIHL